jgi:hypothetical protein
MFELIVIVLLVVLLWQTRAGNVLMTQILQMLQKPVPFPDDVIKKQTDTVRETWLAGERAIEDWTERYGGKTLDGEELRDCKSQAIRIEELERKAKRERRFADEMIEANARVASGKELLSDAYDRVMKARESRAIDDARNSRNPDGPVQTS